MQGKERSFANSLQQTGTLSKEKCSEVILVPKHFEGANFRKEIILQFTFIRRFSLSTLSCACAAIVLAACGSGGSGDVGLEAQSSTSGGVALTQGAKAAIAASASDARTDQLGTSDSVSPSTPAAGTPVTQVVTDTSASPSATPGAAPTQTNSAAPAPVQQGPELCERKWQAEDVQAA